MFAARLAARPLRMSRLLPVAAAVAVAVGEAGNDRGAAGAGGSGGMPGGAEEGIEMGVSLVLLLAPRGEAGCCLWSPLLPWR